MKLFNDKNKCRSARNERCGAIRSVKMRLLERLSDHVAECPRCQRRLAVVNRVELGLTLMNTQPLEIGLLSRANNQALGVLKHSLRNAPKSAFLRNAKSDMNRLEKMSPGLERLLNAAACVFVVLMIKTGVSNSLLDYKEQAEVVIHNYYARNLDSQMFDEIFPIDSSSTG
jgi:hypothetical protein